MTPDRAFLDAVLANPDDDTPRLVYADWLEENGDGPRAEFIRLQCQAAKRSGWGPSRRQSAATDREAIIEVVHGDQWQPEVPASVRRRHGTFRRGFAALLRRDAEDWLTAPALYDPVTPVEGVDLWDARREVGDVLREPHLARLRSLTLPPDLGMWGPDFRACQHLTGLEHLSLGGGWLTDAGAAMMAGAAMPNLVTLEANRTQFSSAGMISLARSAQLPRLRRLMVASDHRDLGIAELARSPELVRINGLDLSRTRLEAAGVRALAGSPHVAGLHELGLGMTLLRDDAARALAASPYLSQLEVLELHTNHVTQSGMAALAAAPFGRLQYLSVSHNPVGSAGVRSLARSETLLSLQELDLDRTRSEGELDVAPLAGSQVVARVTRLNLARNDITSTGAEALAASPSLTRLTGLNLSGNAIGNRGAEALASSPVLRNVTRLDLSGNNIGVVGARALARSPHLGHLIFLHLGNNKIGDRGALALAGTPNLPPPPYFSFRGVSTNRLTALGAQALRDRWGNGVR
jgi:uncharacterized protein (TIGR02996 family)